MFSFDEDKQTGCHQEWLDFAGLDYEGSKTFWQSTDQEVQPANLIQSKRIESGAPTTKNQMTALLPREVGVGFKNKGFLTAAMLGLKIQSHQNSARNWTDAKTELYLECSGC